MKAARNMHDRPRSWLLLRGLGRETRYWAHFPALMEASGFRVQILDLPGMGTEADRHSPLRIEGITDDLRRRWQRMQGEEPVGLLAISLGGMVALDWVARYDSDFSRAVVVNSSSSLSPFYHRLRPSALVDLLRAVLPWSRHAAAGRIYERVCNSDAEREALLRLWRDIDARRPLRSGEFFRQLVAATRFRAPATIPVPLLVLVSSRDRLVDPNCSRLLARHYGADLRVHPWGGHDLPMDDGPWIVRQLLDR